MELRFRFQGQVLRYAVKGSTASTGGGKAYCQEQSSGISPLWRPLTRLAPDVVALSGIYRTTADDAPRMYGVGVSERMDAERDVDTVDRQRPDPGTVASLVRPYGRTESCSPLLDRN